MKKFLALFLLPLALLHGAAGDIKFAVKSSNNVSWIDVILAKQNNALFGTDGSGIPIIVTAGSGITIASGIISSSGGSSLPSQGGHAGQFLTTDGTNASWAAVSGSGTVTGPVSSTTNAVALWTNSGGTAIKDSAVTVASGVMLNTAVAPEFKSMTSVAGGLAAHSLSDGAVSATFAINGSIAYLDFPTSITFRNSANANAVLGLFNAQGLTVPALDVTASIGAATVWKSADAGVVLKGKTGATDDLTLLNVAGSVRMLHFLTGTNNAVFEGNVTTNGGTLTSFGATPTIQATSSTSGNTAKLRLSDTVAFAQFTLTGGLAQIDLPTSLTFRDSSNANATVGFISASGFRLPASTYLNFGATSGTSGYGVRDNAGAMEFKNTGGTWAGFTSGSNVQQSFVATAAQTVFTLTGGAPAGGIATVSDNGVVQRGGTDYSISGSTITFSSGVTLGHIVQATYSAPTGGGGGSGTVTSVAATVPAFLSVSGSPITNSGTLAISYSGTALPVVNGGTGTTTPALVAGTNVTITGTWPNQTVNATGSGGGGDVVAVLVNTPTTLTATTTLNSTYFGKIVHLNPTSAAITITLPAVSGNADKSILFVVDATATKLITLDGNGSETIDGSLTRIIRNGESAHILVDHSATTWNKIGGKSIPMSCTGSQPASNPIATGTNVKVSMTSAVFDPDGMIDTTAGVVNILRPGAYVVSAGVYFNNVSAPSTFYSVTVYLNTLGTGTSIANGNQKADVNGYPCPTTPAMAFNFALADQIIVGAAQFSGLTQDVLSNGSRVSVTESQPW